MPLLRGDAIFNQLGDPAHQCARFCYRATLTCLDNTSAQTQAAVVTPIQTAASASVRFGWKRGASAGTAEILPASLG